MSYRETEIARQTDIRRRLLANGYSPVPNYDKRCFMVGRNDVVVDGALIDVWSTQLKNLSTGVRVQWPLVAIDIDVDDVPALEAIVDALPEELWDKVRHAPVRRSSSRTKEAWFVRLDEGCDPFSRLTSASFFHPEDPDGEDGTTHRVEIFGPESGQQMGVFGAHTRDDSDVTVVHKDYVWDGPSLLDVAIWDLPVLTRAEVAAIADTTTRVLTDIGWGRKLRSKSGFSSPQTLFDLDEDKAFEVTGGETLSLGELLDVARGERGVRLAASFHSPGSHNTSRCVANYGSDGVFRIIDFETGNTHRIASEAPKPVTMGALDRLQALAAGGTIFDRGGASASEPVADTPVGVQMAGDMDSVLEVLLAEYAYVPSEQRCVVPLGDGPAGAMTLGNFRTLMQPHAVEVQGPRGGTQIINPANLWSADPRRVDLSGFRFRPDVGSQLVEEEGKVYGNLYIPLPWPDVSQSEISGAGRAFEMLLSHLVPDDAARSWFRMWLASKVQRPHATNCGVLMIAQQQGTGRGTLMDMMQAAVGKRYYKSINSTALLGQGSQGAYTHWQAQALLVTVEEVMAGGDSGTNMAWKRREAYERIKQLVDPRQRTAPIIQKGLQNYDQDVFFSLLMATNHMDALPLDQNDRRIAALIQPDVRFEDVPELKAEVDPWRAGGSFGDVFGAALRQHLMSVAVDFASLRIAPDHGGGRELMRQANEGDLEDILRSVLAKAPGDYMLNRDLKRRMQIAITAEGEGDHLKNWWVRVQDILKRPNSFGWAAMPTRQNYHDESGARNKAVVYYRPEEGDKAWVAATEAERLHMLAPASDVNRMLTAAARALREGKLSVVETVSGGKQGNAS